MPGNKVGGQMSVRGGGQLAGGFATSEGGGRGNPPAPQTNPMVYEGPGNYLFGVPKGVSLITVEQWGGGGGGSAGTSAVSGGYGGGGGAYAKFTMGGPLIVAGGTVQITIGTGGAAGVGGQIAQTGENAPAANVGSHGGSKGDSSPDGGLNVITTGTGLTIIADTPGAAGSKFATTTGGDGGDGGGAGGGAGGAGGAPGKNGTAGTAPGGGGGGYGAGGGAVSGAGGAARVSISWVPPA